MVERGSWREALARVLGDAVAFDVPLAPKVAFRVGGPADAFVRARSRAELKAALAVAYEYDVPVTLLGTGANVLIADEGIRGLVLRLAGELSEVHVARTVDGGDVEVGAGALNATLVSLLLNLGLAGLEFLATIPGTFGGALVMNAGAHGRELGTYIRSVEVFHAARGFETREREACGFGYRASAFQPGEVIVSGNLVVPSGDEAQARDALAAMRARRKATQPVGWPNAGSVFKNPPGDYAGRLMEAAGLKGRCVGGAKISDVHANFIVNMGGATARDVASLAEEAREVVRDRFQVELEWEVRRLGRFDPASPPSSPGRTRT